MSNRYNHVLTIDEMIGTLGELLDDTEHKDLPEYARKSISEVYKSLCIIDLTKACNKENDNV